MYVNVSVEKDPDSVFVDFMGNSLGFTDSTYKIEVSKLRDCEGIVVNKDLYGKVESIYIGKMKNAIKLAPKVERVIFEGPATVVFWSDGDKTVAKCTECWVGRTGQKCPLRKTPERCSRYSREKGLMAAMLKKLYKNFEDVLRDAGAY